mmetsp:Transcript_17608/g.66989  ORF Transcript_17608/g.66989 Transcript_17608/m.66989 type:complete len:104 (+) Transcript_17608:504-815(+)
MLSPRRALGARRAPKSPALPNASGGEMTDGDDADGGGSVGAAEASVGGHTRVETSSKAAAPAAPSLLGSDTGAGLEARGQVKPWAAPARSRRAQDKQSGLMVS